MESCARCLMADRLRRLRLIEQVLTLGYYTGVPLVSLYNLLTEIIARIFLVVMLNGPR